MKKLRRLSASEPMSMADRGNGVLILGRSRVSCGVVVSLKLSVSGDVGNYFTR